MEVKSDAVTLLYPVTLLERKGSFCVSTVSIVCSPTEHLQCRARVGSTAVTTNGNGRTREMLPGAGSGPSADAADGADGIFERRAYPDYSISGSTFTTEGNVDAADLLRIVQRASQTADNTGWPKNPRVLAGHLRRAQTFLRAALSVQQLRSLMSSRTQAAIGSVSTMPSIAALRLAVYARAVGRWSRGGAALGGTDGCGFKRDFCKRLFRSPLSLGRRQCSPCACRPGRKAAGWHPTRRRRAAQTA
jgi:hypothetical protein